MIRAGLMEEVDRASGAWVFVDLGFAQSARSCGIVEHDGEPVELTFAGLCERVSRVASEAGGPLNLLLEAPLSVAFLPNGNPTGRAVERRGRDTRYWYVGLGCTVLTAATYLLREVVERHPRREVRLFEGFVSFKAKGVRSSHAGDVLALREAVWRGPAVGHAVVPPERLAAAPDHVVRSAFAVAGMDFGVPPVIMAEL